MILLASMIFCVSLGSALKALTNINRLKYIHISLFLTLSNSNVCESNAHSRQSLN